jgi:hypothetical protein
MDRRMKIPVVLMLAALPVLAGAKPTGSDIAAARAECRDYAQLVKKLEASGTATQATLDWERSSWDRACAYAERLMVEAGIEKPSALPKAPPETPQIVITESRPVVATAPASAPASVVAAPAGITPAAKPGVAIKQWPIDQLVITEPVRLEASSLEAR